MLHVIKWIKLPRDDTASHPLPPLYTLKFILAEMSESKGEPKLDR